MLNQLKDQSNFTLTENGATTYGSSMSDCLDFFATMGALRWSDEAGIIVRFERAYAENPDMAMKLLFFARDIRGGLGERRVFRIIMQWLSAVYPSSAKKNLMHISKFGRYDDLLCLLETNCEQEVLALIKSQFDFDMAALRNGRDVSLLGKWLPSVNASNTNTRLNAKRIARHLGLNDATYRKALTQLRGKIGIIENNLRTGDYTFDYSKQPSKAMLKYREAFIRNDKERFLKFIHDVKVGKATLHTGTVTPGEIIAPCISDILWERKLTEFDRESIDAAWLNQENFTDDENAIAVADSSGSMFLSNCTPAAIAQSLAIYFAERNRGVFHNHFITFSRNPRLIEIKGRDIYQKVEYCMNYSEVSNTNIQGIFDLILDTAVKNKVTQEELPATIYIISDMEFDDCAEGADITNFECAKAKYEEAGYELPRVIFWNANSRNIHQPVRKNEQGVALVSGSTARVFEMIRQGEISPYAVMFDVISSERYADISA